MFAVQAPGQVRAAAIRHKQVSRLGLAAAEIQCIDDACMRFAHQDFLAATAY